MDKAPRAREAAKTNHEAARATRGLPLLPRASRSDLHTCPQKRSDGRWVALAIQDRSAWLRGLSPEHIRHLARPYFAAGWTGADVLHALDHDPGGRQHRFSAGVRSAAGWARARLAQWLDPDGTPLPSASRARAAAAARDRAEQAQRRAEHAERAARRGEPPQLADQLRARPLPVSSPSTAPASKQAGLARATAEDPAAGRPLRGGALARALLAARHDPGQVAAILAQAGSSATDPDPDLAAPSAPQAGATQHGTLAPIPPAG